MNRSNPYADLHTHSSCSDGVLPPVDLIDRAAERGLRVLSITDHDTVEALGAAAPAAEDRGIVFVPGVELSSTIDGIEVHLLAYGIDPGDDALREHLQSMKQARQRRVRRIVDRLRHRGIALEDDVLAEEVASSPSVGRPHVAAALVRAGHVDTIEQAFNQYLARDRPAFVAKPDVSAEDTLALVHDAGGIGVLAHPGHWISGSVIRQLVEAGLDGIEVVHPAHDASLRRYYERLARGYDLVATGGSDYHGRSPDDDVHLGTLGLTRAEWERFRDAAL